MIFNSVPVRKLLELTSVVNGKNILHTTWKNKLIYVLLKKKLPTVCLIVDCYLWQNEDSLNIWWEKKCTC